ncbi:Pol polyprotein [Lonchura striata]|uniref:Pol polyprotein n=1 Tax=Lonchura striata TaxID=40157 RepID=A0A218ULS0_9PASE|nr:Pol polyprotein [Lonchura striata domestica]
MERQAAYDLFTAFLQRRQIKGIDLQKDLPGLLAYGYAKGFFVNPHTVHELSEWHKFVDKLWEDILDDDKTAKELGKLWKLLQHQAEKKAAAQGTSALEKNRGYSREDWLPCVSMPPAVSTVELPPLRPVSEDTETESRCEPTAPPAPSEQKSTVCQSLSASKPTPRAESDLTEALARERREVWATLAREELDKGDGQALELAAELACPVIFQQQAGGGLTAQITLLDWKLLSQLRATVIQFGVTSEPARHILDYVWSTNILLPGDCRSHAKLIFSPHQRLLFGAHWQAEVNEDVAMQRQPGDPLHGVTVDELMGLGPYFCTEAQAMLGPEKCREAMRLARRAIDKVKDLGGLPAYMGIKQGRDETFGAFIDKAAAAIERAGVPEFMHYIGEIMIMVHTPFPPIRINKGQRIAQLVPLEQVTKAVSSWKAVRHGGDGFGSTGGLTLLTLDLNDRLRKEWIGKLSWMVRPQREKEQIPGAITAYTDAGKRSRTAAITWQEQEVWNHEILTANDSDTLQTLELAAVAWALTVLKGPLNIVTDSLYVVGVVERIEDAAIKEVRNQRLFELFIQLQKAVKIREHPYAIIHIRSHKWETGLGEGNAGADKLIAVTQTSPLSGQMLARETHSMFHQNAKGLQWEFGISHANATAIVRACPICSHHNGGHSMGWGVNPRGLSSNELWQMDVTHVNSFGRLKYVHVTIDTYSSLWVPAKWTKPALDESSLSSPDGSGPEENLREADSHSGTSSSRDKRTFPSD